jgi:hypothetical protein
MATQKHIRVLNGYFEVMIWNLPNCNARSNGGRLSGKAQAVTK